MYNLRLIGNVISYHTLLIINSIEDDYRQDETS